MVPPSKLVNVSSPCQLDYCSSPGPPEAGKARPVGTSPNCCSHTGFRCVHKIDQRSDRLSTLGAEVVEGDSLDFHSVERAVRGVSTVYFAYPVQAGLLDATAIMADAARRAGVTRLAIW